MQVAQVLALGVFLSYFLLILWLFTLLIQGIRLSYKASSGSRENKGKIAIFFTLTVASFSHTWFYMFKYMMWSFVTYESKLTHPSRSGHMNRASNWLVDTSLFEEAWGSVCFGSMNWWWSEQLCLFTVGSWTVFLFTEGSRHEVKYLWAYMLLGQVVAISVASNLFYVTLLLSNRAPCHKHEETMSVPPLLWLSVFMSLATVATSPFTSTHTFLPNLLVMHALLLVPIVASNHYFANSTRYSLNLGTLYFLVLLASIPIRSRTVLAALNDLDLAQRSPLGLFQAAWATLHSHPAQSSIGWDVIWTTVSFIAWFALDSSANRKRFTIPYLLVATPFTSIGLTAPDVLRRRASQQLTDLHGKRD